MDTIIVSPDTGDVTVVVDRPIVTVEAVTPTVQVTAAGPPGPPGAPGSPGPAGPTTGRVEHPNSVDVAAYTWDAPNGRWQLTHYDSGWRDIRAGKTVPPGSGMVLVTLSIRRVGALVELQFDASWAATLGGSYVIPIPAGFRPSTDTYGIMQMYGRASSWVSLGPDLYWFGPPATADGERAFGHWFTSDAVPAGLPGTMLSPAP